MSVILEPLHQLLDVLVQQRVLRDGVGPLLKLLFRREFPKQDEIRRFEVGAVLGEFLDWIAAVPEDAFVAVDIGDGAAAGRGVEKSRVVGHQAGVVSALDLLEIRGANRPVLDGNLVLPARAVVGNRQGVSHKPLVVRLVVVLL